MAIYGTGEYVVYPYKESTLVINVETGNVVRQLNHDLHSIVFYGNICIARKCNDDLNYITVVIDIISGTIIGGFDEAKTSTYTYVTLHPKYELYYSGTANYLAIKSLHNNEVVLNYINRETSSMSVVDFFGDSIIIGRSNGDCVILNIFTGVIEKRYENVYQEHIKPNKIYCSPDMIHFIITYRNYAIVWNIQTDTYSIILKKCTITHVTFNNRGTLMLIIYDRCTGYGKIISFCELFTVTPTIQHIRTYTGIASTYSGISEYHAKDIKFYKGDRMFIILYSCDKYKIYKTDYDAEFTVLKRCLLPELCNIIGEYAAINNKTQALYL